MIAKTLSVGTGESGALIRSNLKKNESVLHGLLDRLDEHAKTAGAAGARRMPYRRDDLRLAVTHPGGGTAERPVLGRDLFARGAGVIYEGFLYTGAECQLLLRRRMNGQDSVRGRVAGCRHLHGAYHIIDVEFREPIVPKVYVDPSEWSAGAADGEVDPAALVGTVLLLDDQKIDRSLATHCLRGSGIKLLTASSATEALATLRSTSLNLLLTDLNLSRGERGEQAIVKVREVGYRGPIIVVSAETNPERIAGAWAAGANAVLQKPYTRQQLLGAISDQIAAPTSGPDAEPIFSTLFDVPANAPASARPADAETTSLVAQFVGHMANTVAELKRAIADDSAPAARTICQTLKGTGSSYGFPAITDAAKDAVRSLDATQSIDESLVELGRVESICMRLRGGPKPKA